VLEEDHTNCSPWSVGKFSTFHWLDAFSAIFQSNGSKNILTHAKKPKLELKKFYNNPISWHPFWESFESAIQKNTNLNDVDKYQYLKSFLEGSAAGTISD